MLLSATLFEVRELCGAAKREEEPFTWFARDRGAQTRWSPYEHVNVIFIGLHCQQGNSLPLTAFLK